MASALDPTCERLAVTFRGPTPLSAKPAFFPTPTDFHAWLEAHHESAVNIKRVPQLKKMGLMHPAGLNVFAVRSTKNSGIYAYEQRKRARFTREQEKQLRANKAAGEFFCSQAPWCQRVGTWWVVSAKRKKQDASGFPGSSSIRRIGALLPQPTHVKNK